MDGREIEIEPRPETQVNLQEQRPVNPVAAHTSEDINQKRFEKEILKKYDEAIKLLVDNRLREGISMLESLLQDERVISEYPLSPNLPRFRAACHMNMYSALLDLGENRKAIYHMTQYLKIYPKDFKKLYEAGCVLQANGFLKAGAVMLQRALRFSLEAREVEFAVLILDRFIDALFIVGDVNNMKKFLEELQKHPLLGFEDFSNHWHKFECLDSITSSYGSISNFYNKLPLRFHNLEALTESARMMLQKEAGVASEYWDYVNQRVDPSMAENNELVHETVQVKNLNMFSFLDKVSGLLAKAQIFAQKMDAVDINKTTKRQSCDQIKVSWDDLTKRLFVFEYEKIEKRSMRDPTFEEIEEGTPAKLLDEFIVPKMAKVVTKPNISYISRLLFEIDVSLKSLFDFSLIDKPKKRANCSLDRTTVSPFKFEKQKFCLELVAKCQGQSLLNTLQTIFADTFEERTREIRISEKVFTFFGPSIYLRSEFRSSCSDYLKLFNFAFQAVPTMMKFETLLVFLECFQANIVENSKKGYHKPFLNFFRRLEDMYMCLSDEYFTKRAKLYEDFLALSNNQGISFDDYWNSRTYQQRQQMHVGQIDEEQLPDHVHVDYVENSNGSLKPAFPATLNKAYPKQNGELDIEQDYTSENLNLPNFENIKQMVTADIKHRFWKLKRFEQKINPSNFENIEDEAMQQFINECQVKMGNLRRSDISGSTIYWCDRAAVKVNTENGEAFLQWIGDYFNTDEIELLQEHLFIDFTELYADVRKECLSFLPKVITFILEFADKPRKYDGDRFDFVYDTLKDFLQLDTHISSFSKCLNEMDKQSIALPQWIANNNRLTIILLKLYLVQTFMDKKQHQIEAKTTMQLLLHHFLLREKPKHTFILFQCLHYFVDYGSCQNPAIVTYLSKPMQKIRVIDSISHILRNIKPEDFQVEASSNYLQGIHLILTEIRRYFECLYQFKLPGNVFNQLIKQSVPEVTRETLELSKEVRSEVPKLRTICILCENQPVLQNDKSNFKRFAESMILFNCLLTLLSRDNTFCDKMFVQNEPSFGERKFNCKVSTLVCGDLRPEVSLYNLAYKLFFKCPYSPISNFIKFYSQCLTHRKLRYVFTILINDTYEPVANIFQPQGSWTFGDFLHTFNLSRLYFVVVGMRFLEQELLIKINEGANLKEVGNAYLLMENYCQSIIIHFENIKLSNPNFQNIIDDNLFNFLRFARARYRYQAAAIEPLDLQFTFETYGNTSNADEIETQIIHYLLARKKIENNIALMRSYLTMFPGSIDQQRIDEMTKVWFSSQISAKPLFQLLEGSTSKRIDYALIFYAPDLLVEKEGGNIQNILLILQYFFSDSKDHVPGLYINLFKSFFEGKKGDKSLVYKVLAYARILVALFNYDVSGKNGNQNVTDNLNQSRIKLFDTPLLIDKAFQGSLNENEPNQMSVTQSSGIMNDIQTGIGIPNHLYERMIGQASCTINPNYMKTESSRMGEEPNSSYSFQNNGPVGKHQQSNNCESHQLNQNEQASPDNQADLVFLASKLIANDEDSVHRAVFDEAVVPFYAAIQSVFQQKFDSTYQMWHFMLSKIVQHLFKSKNFSSHIFLYEALEVFSGAFKMCPQLAEAFTADLKALCDNFKKIEIVPKERDFKLFFFELSVSRKLIFLQFFKSFEIIPEITESLTITALKLVKSQDTSAGDLSILNAIIPAVAYIAKNTSSPNADLFRAIWALRSSFQKHCQKEPCISYAFNFLIQRTLSFIQMQIAGKQMPSGNPEELKDLELLIQTASTKPMNEMIDLDALFKMHKGAKSLIQKNFVSENK